MQQHLAEVPHDSEAYRLWAHAAAEGKDAEAALAAAVQAVAIAPADADAYLAVAVAQHTASNRDEADTAIQEALRLNPQEPRFYVQLAMQTIVHQRWTELGRVAREGLAFDPRSDYLLFAQALASSRTGFHDIAVRQIEEGLAINPENANLLTLKGALLVDGGNVKEGMPHLLDALRITPNSKYAHMQLRYARLAGWFSAIPRWLQQSACFLGMLVALYVVSVAALLLQWFWEMLTSIK